MADEPKPATRDDEYEQHTCPNCGLVYRQTTDVFLDGTMHAMCPRCNQINQGTA